MSRNGATAVRAQVATRLHEEDLKLVESEGLSEGALLVWQRREEGRIEASKIALNQLLVKLGLPEQETFVLDDFLGYAAPHQRVCAKVDDLLINFNLGYRDQKPHLQLIVGRCTECGEVPCLMPVRFIEDFAKPVLPHLVGLIREYRCRDCRGE